MVEHKGSEMIRPQKNGWTTVSLFFPPNSGESERAEHRTATKLRRKDREKVRTCCACCDVHFCVSLHARNAHFHTASLFHSYACTAPCSPPSSPSSPRPLALLCPCLLVTCIFLCPPPPSLVPSPSHLRSLFFFRASSYSIH